MLSKEQKIKYGQQLRRQMQQKEQKKRFQQDQKRGIHRSPTDNAIKPFIASQNNNIQQNPKQSLQQRNEAFQKGNYGYPGPTTRMQPKTINNQNYNNIGKQQQYIPPHDNYDNYAAQNNQLEQNRLRGYERQNQYANSYDRGHPYQLRQQPVYYPNNFQPGSQHIPQYQQGYHKNNYHREENLQGNPQRQNFNSINNQGYQNPQMYPPQTAYNQAPTNYQQQNQYEYGQYDKAEIAQPMEQIKQKHTAFRQKTLQNQQLMEIHKKGGRNLLQLENMSVDQQQIKQKQKQQMRKQLQMQMKEAEQRKQKQIQRNKREQLEEERRNQQYLLQQKRKIDEQQKKKNDKQRQLIEQNAKNYEEGKRLEEEAKQKAKREKYGNPSSAQVQNKAANSPKLKAKQNYSRQAQTKMQDDETFSENSSESVIESAFKTDISRQFFEKQRRKNQQRHNRQKNLQSVTDQIQRLKQQIDRQNQLFKKQIQKVKLQSQMAEHEKVKAQRQIQSLKDQLQNKMADDNERLFKALQKQQRIINSEQESGGFQKSKKQSRGQLAQNYQNVEVLKPPKNTQKVVMKKYNMNNRQQEQDNQFMQSNVSENGMGSLRGDSKKIPLNLPNQKLSMSQLSQFARETQYFRNGNKGDNMKKTNMNVHESIVEQEQQRYESRNQQRNSKQLKTQQYSNGNKDSLDQMVQSRQKSRGGWGEMSSVNSDITKQIEQLLKKKQKHKDYDLNSNYNYQPEYSPDNNGLDTSNARPSSHLSNAGRRAVSKHGYEYEGASLNTINSGGNGGINSIDIDRIHNRNQARLNQFRKLGVETINSNNDGQLSKLDQILNRYKQGKSRVDI